MSDPFAQAFYDYHFEEMKTPLLYRRGDVAKEAEIGSYFEVADAGGSWLAAQVDGPLLDMGAGAGRHSLYFQQQFETVAIEQTEALVELLRDRGVEDVRHADMFSLRDSFEADRFESAIALGTQTSLARSMEGLVRFLDDLARVTTPTATAVLDGYDPEHPKTKAILDYYDDIADGLAYRLLQMEYDGVLGDIWLYRLFTPDRIREATAETDWELADLNYTQENLYQAALTKA